MVTSANWVPTTSWGGQGLVPPCGNDSSDGSAGVNYSIVFDEESFSTNSHHQHGERLQPRQHQQPSPQEPFLASLPPHIDCVDESDEEMEPFDAERFVDRLVEDDPPPWRQCVEGGKTALWESSEAQDKNFNTSADYNYGQQSSDGMNCGGKLFLEPAYSWPPPPPTAGVALLPPGGGRGNAGGGRDNPIVVPHDPVLDTMLTPCRVASPEILPTVTVGLVSVPPPPQTLPLYGGLGGGFGISDGIQSGRNVSNYNAIKGFMPAAICSIPPAPAAAECLKASSLRVPMAPVRQESRGRGFFPSSRRRTASPFPADDSDFYVESAAATAASSAAVSGECSIVFASSPPAWLSPSGKGVVMDKVRADAGDTGGGGCSAQTSKPMTGADSFSQEYDDERHAFLRQQELALFVGPGYLAAPGRPGFVTPADRKAMVDWLSDLHKAAPIASGGGGEPLSHETLFLAVNLLDRFMSTAEGARTAYAGVSALKVAGAASLALASKYEDTHAVSLWGVSVAAAATMSPGISGTTTADDVLFGALSGAPGVSEKSSSNSVGGGRVVDATAARKEVAAMELKVASALGFRLTVPTALSFLGVFLRRACLLGYLLDGPMSERVRDEAQQILSCVLRDSCSLEHPPSALAAAALYWASCVSSPGAAAPESFAFFAVTGYKLEKLCRCLRDMEAVRTSGNGSEGRHGGGGGIGGVSGAAVGGGADWAGAALPEHAGKSLFGAGGGHPAIAAL